MKTLLFFTFILLQSFFSFCQNNKLFPELEKKLKGNVKTVREIKYKEDIMFGELIKGKISSQSFSKLENGNTIERIEYNSSGILSSKHDYLYDAGGNQIEQMNYRSNGSVFLKRTYRYDSSGNQIESATYASSGELISLHNFIYSKTQIEENSISPVDGNLTSKIIYKNDDNKNIIGLYSIDYSDSNKNYKYEFLYDEKNNLIQKKYFVGSYEYGYDLFKYNEKGNLMEEDYFFHGKLKSKKNYKYNYDLYDNWIQRIIIRTEYPSEIIFPEYEGFIEREITYK
jgi:hypothetical protein